jgi:hypothetical protein
MLIKANYNQQMWGTSWGTDYSTIKLFVLELAIMKKLLGILVLGLRGVLLPGVPDRASIIVILQQSSFSK